MCVRACACVCVCVCVCVHVCTSHRINSKVSVVCIVLRTFMVGFFTQCDCLISPYSYIPVLMAQAKIYWDMENYAQVEKVLIKTLYNVSPTIT